MAKSKLRGSWCGKIEAQVGVGVAKLKVRGDVGVAKPTVRAIMWPNVFWRRPTAKPADAPPQMLPLSPLQVHGYPAYYHQPGAAPAPARGGDPNNT